MTKEEAIDRLKRIARCAVHIPGEEPFVMSLDDGIAVHMAISALEQMEKVQPSDSISKQALIEDAREAFKRNPTTAIRVMDWIKNMPSAQTEPIRINLNELIKVKLTDWGKETYYHRYDRLNQIARKKIFEPKLPKEDENGYAEFQLWCFIELYGEHMGMTLPNVIEPLEIVYERRPEKKHY